MRSIFEVEGSSIKAPLCSWEELFFWGWTLSLTILNENHEEPDVPGCSFGGFLKIIIGSITLLHVPGYEDVPNKRPIRTYPNWNPEILVSVWKNQIGYKKLDPRLSSIPYSKFCAFTHWGVWFARKRRQYVVNCSFPTHSLRFLSFAFAWADRYMICGDLLYW